MIFKKFAGSAVLLAVLSGSPALAYNNPLDSGPLADFLNIFRQSAIPRRTVIWTHGQKPGIIVISTSQRRLYCVLRNGQALEYGVGVGRTRFLLVRDQNGFDEARMAGLDAAVTDVAAPSRSSPPYGRRN